MYFTVAHFCIFKIYNLEQKLILCLMYWHNERNEYLNGLNELNYYAHDDQSIEDAF